MGKYSEKCKLQISDCAKKLNMVWPISDDYVFRIEHVTPCIVTVIAIQLAGQFRKQRANLNDFD